MTAFLPPNLLALFAPREPLPFIPPLQELPCEKKPWLYSGVAQYLSEFEDPSDTPAPTRAETRDERQIRKRKEREERQLARLDKNQSEWDPTNDPNIDGDPFKTLFVARINYDTSESKLRREFETFGAIKKISLVTNNETSKPRGYAFIEYEHERDLRSAYKYADGKKIDGKRVVVDVERGRTVKSWRPRKLGGGLGGTRKGGPDECVKYSGRVDARDASERGEREKDRDNDKEKRSEKDRDRDRDHDRDRDKDRDHSRDRERDRDRDRHRDRDRGRERKRDRERSRSRDKDRSKRRRSRSRDRGEKDKRRDKEREKDKDRHREKRDKDKVKIKEESVNGVSVKQEEDESMEP